ncbi:tumor necrosis factor receptor superfamily member 1B [Neoarius graeffei]|uniref:tumor necrosis factor receptor superfamily member 1B n=1 Tax=Neoarius graeffei TaxID=443677 RepID=UPI00298D0DBE|nr:tumor necrosis factor receptor superfamily member 1B [Neoarius graeffei]
MNVGFGYLILSAVTSLAQAKSYSLPYVADGKCRDSYTEYMVENRCCSKCSPGTRKKSDCTSVEDTVCVPCPLEMYSDNWNYFPNCFLCSKCLDEKGMKYAKQCAPNSNAVCVCKPGWYCLFNEDSPSCTTCEKHRMCAPGKGSISPGTSTENVKCGNCPSGTFSNETSMRPCQPHTRCELQGRHVLIPGTDKTDTVCSPIPSTTPSLVTTRPWTTRAKASSSPTEPPTKPSTSVLQSTSMCISSVVSPPSLDNLYIGLWIGLLVVTALVVLLIVGFCICHRKGLGKPAIRDAVEVGQCSNSVHLISPTEHHGLLADSSSDPSTSSSSDSHSQGTGVSQDCLHVDPPIVSSPIVNLNITLNCQMNPPPPTIPCSIPVSPCVQVLEPEFPISQEEEHCVSCEQEDSKDAMQSVQETGMTKY